MKTNFINRLLIFIFLLTIGNQLTAQDIIVKKDGSELQTKVIEISLNTIKYRLFNQQNGPIRNIEKKAVFMIIYENGTRETINTSIDKNPLSQKSNDNSDKNTKAARRRGTIIRLGHHSGEYTNYKSLVVGYQVGGKKLATAFLLGIHTYDGMTGIPVLGEFKYHFTENTNSFFAYAELGGVVLIEGSSEESVLYGLGLGRIFSIGSKTELFISSGFNIESVTYEDYFGETNTESYDFFNIKLGIKF
ncbi:MAG: hypothetical protein N4A49_01505 [Marinifilaceae bacterium]|jgi:hypothetical protein|nr:hypothetical protein [Marinifilaceae bacterium]